jgi:hypothetical protein
LSKYTWCISPELCKGAAEGIFFWFDASELIVVTLYFGIGGDEDLFSIGAPAIMRDSDLNESDLGAGDSRLAELFDEFVTDISSGRDAVQNPPSLAEFCYDAPDIRCPVTCREIVSEAEIESIVIGNDSGKLREVFYAQSDPEILTYEVDIRISGQCIALFVNEAPVYKEHRIDRINE